MRWCETHPLCDLVAEDTARDRGGFEMSGVFVYSSSLDMDKFDKYQIKNIPQIANYVKISCGTNIINCITILLREMINPILLLNYLFNFGRSTVLWLYFIIVQFCHVVHHISHIRLYMYRDIGSHILISWMQVFTLEIVQPLLHLYPPSTPSSFPIVAHPVCHNRILVIGILELVQMWPASEPLQYFQESVIVENRLSLKLQKYLVQCRAIRIAHHFRLYNNSWSGV